MFQYLDVFLSFFLIVTCYHSITATDIIKDDELDKGTHSQRDSLWFGPRLGKRSLQLLDEENSQAILKLLEAADAVKYYYNEMQADAPQTKVTKKVIFTPKLGRAADFQEKRFENVEFTPRLGRKLSDKIPFPPSDEDSYSSESIKTNVLASRFVPRIGRNYNFSPRLGRELIYDLYTQPQIRVARSVNKTKSQF